MSRSESLDYLFSLEQPGIKLGLENIQKLCAALGHPEKTFKSVIVAGTNGKGSVCRQADTRHLISSALKNVSASMENRLHTRFFQTLFWN